MIEDEGHPEMIKAHQEVLRRLGGVLWQGNRVADKAMMQEMFDVITRHRDECRLRGIAFPVLVAIVVPRLGLVHFQRADLDMPSIRTSIVNLVRSYPRASMEEIVNAFKAAYPDLRPDDVLMPVDKTVRALAAKQESGKQ